MLAHTVSAPIGISLDSKAEHRLQALLALFHGEPMAQVATRFGICRSDLYKFRQRALVALAQALADHRRGPRLPHNSQSQPLHQRIRLLCARYPTDSAYQIGRRLSTPTVSPRTIQRLRQRLSLPRLPKRAPPTRPTISVPGATMQLARALIRRQPYLGAQRLAWDLRNQEGCAISASTMKRLKRRLQEETTPAAATTTNWCFYQRKHPHSLWHGDYLEKVTLHDTDQTAYQLTLQDDYSHAYVFCDLFTAPNVVTTIAALIAAMRAYQTIPRAVVFDNGQNFRGRLLQAFCRHLDIRLIHTSVHHPQTNGKLERAFRDDMREFYRQQPRWVLAPLRRALPKYV